MDMRKLLLATNNPGKVEEMRAILVHLNLCLLTPADLGLDLQVSEDGATYAENATLKAITFAKASSLTSLADDSGLEVDVLDGRPGLHSHRFAPWPEATDADRRIYLLKKLQDKARPWLAHFHATVALAQPDGTVRVASGECPGEIIPDERGTNGFGYDPIFYFPSLGRTMAELSMHEKNRLSHRARALRNAEAIISEMLGI
jgi:XTP/dITP diphosphohydrolase